MKNKKALLCSIAIFCFVPLCFAAPIYGPRMPEKKQFFVGAQTHWVEKRYLEKEYGRTASLQHFLLISYGIADWLSLDLKGGAGSIRTKPSTAETIEYTSGLAGGYGFRLRLHEAERSKIVFGFQHISVHPESTQIGEKRYKAVLDDWQFSLLASYAFSRATAYLGTRWSRMDHIHWVESDRKRERSDFTKSVGVIAGVEVPMNRNLWITVEASTLDAESVAVSVTKAF